MKKIYLLTFRNLFFCLCFFFFLLTSCLNDDGPSGDQCFDNRTDEPLDLYINGIYDFTLDEENFDCLFLGFGCFDWYVEGVLTGFYSEGTICIDENSYETTIVIDD